MMVPDVGRVDLDGFDAVAHLAAVSNDRIGDLNPSCTYKINHRASLGVARAANEAAVRRLLQAERRLDETLRWRSDAVPAA